jgi:hypothetical protein
MDIGVKEETYEYYRAKKIKSNEWSKKDEENYEYESDPKIPFRRIEPMLKIDLNRRRLMDQNKTETEEYYRAKKIKMNQWSVTDEEELLEKKKRFSYL